MIFLICFLLIILMFLLSSFRYDQKSEMIAWQEQTTTGTVVSKVEKAQTVQYLLRSVTFRSDKGTMRARYAVLYTDQDDIPIGSRIMSTGPVQGFSHRRNEGGFDYAAYYKFMGVQFCQFPDEIRITKRPYFSGRELLYRFRKWMRKGICAAAEEDDQGILCAMVLGDRSLLTDDLRMMYQTNGISHILAISGLHISVLGMTLFRLLRRIRKIHIYLCCLISGSVVAGFVVMSGMSVSAVRAMIMFFFYLGAACFGRKYDTVTALFFSAVFQLLFQPLAIMQTGFLLSYGAVLSAGVVLPAVKTVCPVPGFCNRIPGGVDFFSSAQLSFAVWIGLMPLSAYLFHYVSPYSILLNLVVIPCCGILLADGIVCGICGIIFPAGVARISSLPDHWILKLFSLQMQGVDRLPGHEWMTGHIPVAALIIYYAILMICCAVIYRKSRQRSSGKRSDIWKYKWRPAAVLPGAALIVLLINPTAESFRVDFLDVGQGDGICISDGTGVHVMIDGGSTSEDRLGTDVLLPYLRYHKIRQVDLWIVTHTDEDHVSGLLELLEYGYPVKMVLLSEAAGTDDEMTIRLIEAAKQNQTEIKMVSTGAVIETEEMKMRCLYPNADEEAGDKNDLSQVWELWHDDFSCLFTGDLGEDPEKLLEKRGVLSDIFLLKVGHHGSNYSSSMGFLEAVKPEYAVISVGKGNPYHHPGEEALSRLREAGAQIETTMEHGQITFRDHYGQMYQCFPCGE